MPVDVVCRGDRPTRGSRADYNVLALSAPADRRGGIARTVRHGQEPGAGTIRCCAVRFPCSKSCATGMVHRPASRCSTSASASRPDSSTPRNRASAWPVSVRSAVRSPSSIRPTEAWMVAGGVGLAPFATLAEALRARGVTYDAVLRRATRRRALSPRLCFATSAWTLVLTTEDGSLGERGPRSSRRSNDGCGALDRTRP